MHSTAVKSLRWLTDSQQAALVSVLSQACKWATCEWYCGAEPPKFAVREVPTSSDVTVSGPLFEIVSDAGHLMTLQLASDWARQILNLPTSNMSTGVPSGLMTGLERDFVEALVRRIIPEVLAPGLSIQLLDRYADDGSTKRSRQVFNWISARQVSGGCFTLDSKLVDQLVPRVKHRAASAPSSRRTAIGEQSVVIKAHVGQVDVSFSSLQNLALGDVLVLEAPLAEPISLRNEAGQVIGVGNLGRQDQYRVVRLSNVAANGQADRVMAAKRSIQ